jgi:integrase/recombinase XerD
MTNVSIPEFKRYLIGVKSAATAQKYAEYAQKFLKLMQENGYENFGQMPRGLLSQFASMQSSLGHKPSTVRVQVYAAKKYLDWVRDSGIAVAVQSRPELPKREIRQRPVMPPSMFTAYFRQADLDLKEPIRTAVMLLPCCGLRASEMVALKLSDIHRAQIKLKNGKTKWTLFLRLVGKGGRERNVPLMEEGVEIVTGYLAGWRRRQPGPWLFPRNTGDKTKGSKPIGDRYLRHALQQMREPLGMTFTPHTMRRTYITMLWRKGIDLGTVAKIAGHASIQTTIDHYIIMDPTDAIDALHKAGSALTT